MRKFPLLLLISICTLSLAATPKAVGAASETQAPPAYPQNCPKGASTGDPSGTKTFTDPDPSQLQKHLQQVVYCANACYDEKVTIRVSLGADISGTTMTVLTVASNLCDVKDPTAEDIAKTNRGCAKGQKQPAITIQVPAISHTDIGAQTIGPKSRCDPALKGVADSMLNAASKSDVNGLKDGLTALQNLPAQAPPIQNAGTDALSQAFQSAGLSRSEADTLVAANPQAASNLLQKVAAGDTAGAQAIAKTLGLNPDIATKIAALQPPPQTPDTTTRGGGQNTLGGATISADAARGQSAPLPGGVWGQTFKNAEDSMGLSSSVPGYLAGAAKIESGGDPKVCSPTGPCGLFQYTSATWRKWSAAWNLASNGDPNPLPLSARLDPQLSTGVTAFYSATNLRQYGSLIQQSGMSPYAALYAIHNIGDGGGPKFIRAFAQNPNTPVNRVLDANTIRYNPSIYGNGNISLAQAQQNMLLKMGGSTNFTGNSTYPFSSHLGGATAYNAPYGAVNAAYNAASSAFVGYPFVSSSAGYMLAQPLPPAAPSYQGQQQVGGNQSFQGGQPVLPSQTPSPTYNTTSQPSVPDPAATIIAQPDSITPGTPVQVSWSSVGMKADRPCQVFINSVFLFGEGNEGTKFATTTNATAGQQWTFTLKCTALSGASIRQAAAVQIR